MKRWLLHILLVSVLGMLAASCSQEADDPTLATEGGRVQLKFTIVLDESPASRTWGSTYDPEEATKAENTIQNMQVILFNTAGDVCYGELENVQYFATDHDTYKEYEFQGSIPVSAVGTDKLVVNDKLNCKIMVLANCAIDFSASEFNATTALNNLSYEIANIYSSSTGLKAGIPMWGIHTVTNLPVDRNYATDLDDDIYLLRSMAKIEVTLSDETWNNDYRITSATLNKYNAEGYIVPTFNVPVTTNGTTTLTEKALNEFTETTDLSLEGVLREKSGLATTPATLGFTATTANRTYVVYVPEMNNTRLNETTDTNGSIWVDLTLAKINSTSTTDDDDITGSVMGGHPRIYLKDYDITDGNDGLYSPTRNHLYRYTINQISDGFDLTVQAMPWTKQSVKMSFTDIVSYNVTGWTAGTTGDIDEENNLVYMTKDKAAEFTFRIVTPTGLTKDDLEIGLTNNQDFSLNYEFTNDGSIKISISPTDTESNGSALRTSLYAFVKDQYGRNVELDLTGTGTGDQEVGSTTETKANRFTIIRTW